MMETFRLMIDFGLVILIWIVQLVVYPSFLYFTSDGLKKWHGNYSRNISFVVAPLMLMQLLIHAYYGYFSAGFLNYASLLFVLLNWGITFGYAVPLHARIETGIKIHYISARLISINRLRTLFWSLVFLITLFQTV